MAMVENPHMAAGLLSRRRPAANEDGASELSAAAFPTPLYPLSSRSFAPQTSRRCLNRTDSQLRHDEYIAKLEVPTLEQISSIAQIQEEREREVQRKYEDRDGLSSRQQKEAAEKIQRTYRGHRARREMQGLTLDPTTRWIEALKMARYQNNTDPRRRRGTSAAGDTGRPSSPSSADSVDSQSANAARKSIGARENWHHISSIAAHAVGELPGPESPGDNERPHSRHGSVSELLRQRKNGTTDQDQLPAASRTSLEPKPNEAVKRAWVGKMMDLPYFLEMVDQKHRYGSNLRAYHEEWMRSDTKESFFWWLDHGEGTEVEVPNVSRQRLEREQVRYLSREERMNYLVQVDDQGRLVWAKSGKRITTSTEYRDSVDGIVNVDSKVKAWREDEMAALKEGEDEEGPRGRRSSDGWSASSGSPTTSPIRSASGDTEADRRYPDPPSIRDAKGPSKVKHVSAQAILNRILRKTLVAQNTWIFAADTRNNLYVGIKQSGSFQHSSFMRGSRLSAAGTIKIKDGQVRAINPLSGHYRPPTKAFRHFVHHLKDTGVDMSRVSISKSYAVLVGLEAYKSGRHKMKQAEKKIKRGAGMVIHPAKTKEAKEQEKDMSQSAQKEREIEREQKGPLERALEDAKVKVEERWAALDAKRTQDKEAKDVQQVPQIPDPEVPHQEGLDRPYKEPERETGTATVTTATESVRAGAEN